ncbi:MULTISPECIES: hypothetical protein [unclassified Streptomyces]|uniref:hypothetical protein n=1 Tax=unclassified Streptomyces TaxID=2593676 RepID=UPI0022598E61|nr:MULTISPECIES: hypothetical protein [unclassified Streptomyces]MCX5054877.1 hypothetical protein [Streptomyces sp. NBC_00474]
MPARGRSPAYAQPVLHITDARTGESVDAAPARRGLTRVEVHVPGSGAGSLRVLLVADLLVRALELGGTPVWGVLTAERDQAELRAWVVTLGIRPFEDTRDVGTGLGDAQVLHVAAEGDATPEGVRIAVAPVHPEVPGILEGAAPDVLRLALLSHRRGTPVRLDAAALDDARATLARWRRAVASWARQPSRPIPDEARARLRTAWEDDLDVPAVLDVLTWVETVSELPDGARFETYAHADRLLGLDLTRDLGSPA